MARIDDQADVLVTGANGFVGRAVVKRLEGAGWRVRAGVRDERAAVGFKAPFVLGDLAFPVDWRAALTGVRSVVHCAAIAHRAPPRALEAVNVGAVAALAEAAEALGVERFVFLSSIKAAAARTNGAPLTELDPPRPTEAYGRAKLAAEAKLLALPRIRAVALRPPLVHGPGAKANVARLMKLAASGFPLPFAAICNRRSLIAVSTLAGAVQRVLERADGPGGAFFVTDRPALSSAEIIAALRAGLGRKPGLFPAVLPPVGPLAALTQSLEADDARFETAYGYPERPDARAALMQTARAWRGAA